MLPITTFTPGHDLRVHELVAVSRLVSAPAAHLPAALHQAASRLAELPVGAGGRLELVNGFAPVPGARGRWRARARLHGGGLRLVPYARIDVEITPWSPDASELRLHPVSRSPHAWGTRRLRRYLRLATRAADVLTAHLAELAREERARAAVDEVPALAPVAAPCADHAPAA